MNQLIIKSDNTLKELSDYFTKEYPYLKLEFFKKTHENHEGNVMDDIYDKEMEISTVEGIGGEVNLASDMTVSSLEEEMKKKLNLNAQVFRKSGKVWLETTTTDDWTLEEQNSRGEEAFH